MVVVGGGWCWLVGGPAAYFFFVAREEHGFPLAHDPIAFGHSIVGIAYKEVEVAGVWMGLNPAVEESAH